MAAGQGNPRFRRIRHWFYKEGLMVGYRHFDSSGTKPAFSFGFGLSYTDFRIENLKLSGSTIGPEDGLDLSVTVRNTGERTGSEVVQIYVADLESRLPRPVKELKGFAKIILEPGESSVVDISLDSRAFQYWDPEKDGIGGWTAEPGEFRIMAGRSSGTLEAEETVVLH
jgi:beta-glucosidase